VPLRYANVACHNVILSYTLPVMQVRDIIARFGGPQAMSRAIWQSSSDADAARIRMWAHRNSIPGHHFAPIIEAAERAGISVTYGELAEVARSGKAA
jgi:hypothetical protein